jgi:AcrR family transcriptional regulator
MKASGHRNRGDIEFAVKSASATISTMTGPGPVGLRERKRRRTRETIVRVALELFAQRGYRATTLTQIAEAAEIAPSTLHGYFASKEDIVFSSHDDLRDSVLARILNRSHDESLSQAMLAWTSETKPEIVGDDDEALFRRRRATIASEESLRAAERLRLAELEDAFTEAFAQDLGETPADLRARLMASLATHGLNAIWQWWQPRLTDQRLDLHELAMLDATYLLSVLDAAEELLKTIPKAPTHLASNDHHGK